MTFSKGRDSVALFAAGWGGGLLAAIMWITWGEAWEVLADGLHYMAMYEGRATDAPFAYRVLTPFLAQQLPWSADMSFGAVTLLCLSMCAGFLMLFARQSGEHVRTQAFIALFWVCSFAFAYYSTTRVRADAPMLMMMALLVWLAQKRVSAGWLLLLMALGSLSHETMLLGLAALWVDKCLDHDVCGGGHYGYGALLTLTAGTLCVLVLAHKVVPVLPATDKSYLDGPGVMLRYTLSYSGGLVKHGLRIYAAYGPVLLYALLWAATSRERREALSLITMIALATVATFLATDTLRVMAVIYIPILLRAARFVNQAWQRHGAPLGLSLVCLQLLHSGLVFGHLRTFKSSYGMNVAAGLLAVAAMLLTLLASRQVPWFGARSPAPDNQGAASTDFATHAA